MSGIAQRHRRALAVFALLAMVFTYFATVLPAVGQYPGAAAEAAAVAADDGDTVSPPQDWGAIDVDAVENDGQTFLVDPFANGVGDTEWFEQFWSEQHQEYRQVGNLCEGTDPTIAKGNITAPEITSGTPQPNGKSDICQVLVEFDPSISNIETLYVGMFVNGGSGDMSGLVELNKIDGERSEGDVLFALNWDGNDNASIERWSWNGTAWTGYANNAGVGQAHPSRNFGEVEIPLDFIFEGGAPDECTTFVGGYVFSKTGGGNQGNANLSDSLKDVVGFDVSISNCTTVTVDVGGQCVGGGSEGAVTFEATISVSEDVDEVDVTVYSDAGLTTEVDPANLPGPGTYYWTATADFPYEIAEGDESGSFTVTDDCTEQVELTIGGQCSGGGEAGAVVFSATGYEGVTGVDSVTFYSDAARTDEVDPTNLGGAGTYYWTAVAEAGYELVEEDGSFSVADTCTVEVGLTIGGQCSGGGEAGAVVFTASGYDVPGVTVTFYSDMEMTQVVVPTNLPGAGTYYWSAEADPGYSLTASMGSFTIEDTCTVAISVEPAAQCVGGGAEGAVSFVASGYTVEGATVTFFSDAGMTTEVDPTNLPGAGTYYWSADVDPGYSMETTSGSFSVEDTCTVAISVEPAAQCVGGGAEGAVSFVASGYTVEGATVTFFSDAGMTTEVDPTNLPGAGTYYWSADVDPGYSMETTSGSFTVEDTCTVAISVEPVAQCTDTGEGIVYAATGYEVEGATVTFFSDAGMTTEVDPTNLPGAGTYYWSADVDPGYSMETTSGSFTVEDTCTIDLAIEKTDFDVEIVLTEEAPVGQIDYELTVTNNGPAVATGVTVTDTLPVTTVYVADSAVASQGTCAEAAGVITCELGTLEVGASATITLSVTTESLGNLTDPLVENVASVEGDQEESDLSNNEADEETPITEVFPELLPNLSIEKTDLVDPIILTEDDPDGEITYIVTVTNAADAGPAADVEVVDTLPDTVSFLSAVPSTGSCSIAGQVLTCALGDMEPGDEVMITITVATESFGELTVPTVLNTAEVFSEGESWDEDDEPTDIVEVRDELPETGYDSGRLALLGAVVLGAGAMLLATTRRRDDEVTD